MEHRIGCFAALVIATVSGLIVQVVSRPVEKVVSPKVEDALENALDNQSWDNWTDFWKRRDRTDANTEPSFDSPEPEASDSRELHRSPNHLDR